MKNLIKKWIISLSRGLWYRLNNYNNGNPENNGEYWLLKNVLIKSNNKGIVFDVGGAYGEWTSTTMKLKPENSYYVFEPLPSMIEHLKKRFDGCKNVSIVQKAVGSSNNQLTMYLDAESIYQRLSLGRNDSRTVTVEGICIDDFIEQNNITSVQYMKMDIEGNELQALIGAKQSINRSVFDYIQFEYGGCNIDSRTYLKDYFDFFSGSKYRLAKILRNGLEYHDNYDPVLENFQYCNWLAKKIG